MRATQPVCLLTHKYRNVKFLMLINSLSPSPAAEEKSRLPRSKNHGTPTANVGIGKKGEVMTS